MALDNATKLSPLDLNNIRLDVKHTLLTPEYLEKFETDDSVDNTPGSTSQGS